MSENVNISKLHPEAYKAQIALDAATAAAAEDAGLDPLLAELVKIRVSQINGCAFCLRMHSRDALEKGETPDRLALVAAWWESQYFTAQEQAALAIAEQVTNLDVPARRSWTEGGLTEQQQSAIMWLAISINTWNRIAIMSHYPVAP